MTTSIERCGLRAFGDMFNVAFCDVWGVLHNGERVHKRAVEALQHFRQSGAAVILVTNAPRPSHEIHVELLDLGVPEDAFDALVSSGEVTRDLIASYQGKTIYRLGPQSDDGLFDGIDVKFGSMGQADAIVCSDLEFGRTPQDYTSEVLDWKRRELPFICANPDKFVEIGDQLIYCGGALADLYEDVGGKAEKRLQEIAGEIKQKWQISNVAIYHRIGQLKVGDINLVVAIAAAHREEGFAACQYAIDQFKQQLPTRKKETYQDGSAWVEG